jgi:predicted transcriptional regulator
MVSIAFINDDELVEVTGRKRSNLSRTLNTMAKYGIVDLIKDKRTVKPVVKATDFKVEFGVNTSFGAFCRNIHLH